MFLKKGTIPELLYPGAGGENISTISLGKKVSRLYVAMNGFEIGFRNGDNHVKDISVDLSVLHKMAVTPPNCIVNSSSTTKTLREIHFWRSAIIYLLERIINCLLDNNQGGCKTKWAMQSRLKN
jgi:hypothetical protein